MKRILILIATVTFFTPMAGICGSDEDIRTSNAIRELREYKDEGLELVSVTTEENRVRVEGYATGNRHIADFLKMIGEGIGYAQVMEIMPTERNGHHASHFVIELVPYFRALTQLMLIDATPLVKAYSPDEGVAWYTNLKFSPFGKTIRGVPVSQIDSNWCAANEFEKTLFPTSTHKANLGLDEILKNNRSFSISSRFDGRHSLTAIVGVYEACDGQSGTFLLVLDGANRVKPVVFLSQSEKASFAYLEHINANTFAIWDCFACDGNVVYRWDRSVKTFVLERSGDE